MLRQTADSNASLPLVTDGDITLVNLDSTLFPGLSSDIEVHEGFADAQAESVHLLEQIRR